MLWHQVPVVRPWPVVLQIGAPTTATGIIAAAFEITGDSLKAFFRRDLRIFLRQRAGSARKKAELLWVLSVRSSSSRDIVSPERHVPTLCILGRAMGQPWCQRFLQSLGHFRDLPVPCADYGRPFADTP